MEKIFIIKETLTDMLRELVESNSWALLEIGTDAVYAPNYVPSYNSCSLKGDENNSWTREIYSLHELRNSQKYRIMDNDHYSYATLQFTEHGFRIITAWSSYLYDFQITDYYVPCKAGKRQLICCTYKGASKGFLKQALLPTITEWEDADQFIC